MIALKKHFCHFSLIFLQTKSNQKGEDEMISSEKTEDRGRILRTGMPASSNTGLTSWRTEKPNKEGRLITTKGGKAEKMKTPEEDQAKKLNSRLHKRIDELANLAEFVLNKRKELKNNKNKRGIEEVDIFDESHSDHAKATRRDAELLGVTLGGATQVYGKVDIIVRIGNRFRNIDFQTFFPKKSAEGGFFLNKEKVERFVDLFRDAKFEQVPILIRKLLSSSNECFQAIDMYIEQNQDVEGFTQEEAKTRAKELERTKKSSLLLLGENV
eukprot:CAMPEP_0113902058 /NCGR_PEP_ID=MMETSP0780_2-20120614/21620_1 /TAXON_ID=652834 /ORGANISM="Palpitomonas bilix" /LENGTH=269 /DNA_ID=CAMNT_0000894783 /DNA_START=6357 /DNA_END=7166 /DNA_ORIENTATION=+ /assembly_acc=CAM_ASM_000599